MTYRQISDTYSMIDYNYLLIDVAFELRMMTILGILKNRSFLAVQVREHMEKWK